MSEQTETPDKAARTCEHPHRQTLPMQAWSLSYTDYAKEPDGFELVLVLHSEAGRVPYALADNPRSRAAITYLAMRFCEAGVVREATYEPPGPDADPFHDRYVLPHLVLSHALAEREGRYCAADWCKRKIATQMTGGR